MEARITQYIHRPAHLGPISVNPYTLTVRVDSVRIDTQDDGPLVQWDRLAVTYRLRSFVPSGEVVFSAIEWVRPSVRLRRSSAGTLSGQDILDSIAATPSRPLPPASVGRLTIDQLRVEWYDSARTRAFYTQLGPASVDLRDFTTRRDSLSRYTFAGRTEADERFSWKGTLGVAPFASEGEIALEKLLVEKYAPCYGDARPARVTSGTLALDGATPARLGNLHIGGLDADAVTRTATLKELTIADLALDLVRSPRGTLNLAGLMRSGPAPKAAGRPVRATATRPRRAPRGASAGTSAAAAPADTAGPWRWTVHHWHSTARGSRSSIPCRPWSARSRPATWPRASTRSVRIPTSPPPRMRSSRSTVEVASWPTPWARSRAGAAPSRCCSTRCRCSRRIRGSTLPGGASPSCRGGCTSTSRSRSTRPTRPILRRRSPAAGARTTSARVNASTGTPSRVGGRSGSMESRTRRRPRRSTSRSPRDPWWTPPDRRRRSSRASPSAR